MEKPGNIRHFLESQEISWMEVTTVEILKVKLIAIEAGDI